MISKKIEYIVRIVAGANKDVHYLTGKYQDIIKDGVELFSTPYYYKSFKSAKKALDYFLNSKYDSRLKHIVSCEIIKTCS